MILIELSLPNREIMSKYVAYKNAAINASPSPIKAPSDFALEKYTNPITPTKVRTKDKRNCLEIDSLNTKDSKKYHIDRSSVYEGLLN